MFFWVLFTKTDYLPAARAKQVPKSRRNHLDHHFVISANHIAIQCVKSARMRCYSATHFPNSGNAGMREIGGQNNSKYWHFLRTYYHQSAQCCRWDELSKCQPVLRSEIFCDISTKLIKTSHLIFPFCLIFFLNSILCFTLALYVPIWLFRSFRKIWLFSNNMYYSLNNSQSP